MELDNTSKFVSYPLYIKQVEFSSSYFSYTVTFVYFISKVSSE